ncbi:hypothetical protein ZWY2020_003798 [Hordeum vulgare]|nr:hypothetical protein ZWY2020_003798 [Hordeum vulgare]
MAPRSSCPRPPTPSSETPHRIGTAPPEATLASSSLLVEPPCARASPNAPGKPGRSTPLLCCVTEDPQVHVASAWPDPAAPCPHHPSQVTAARALPVLLRSGDDRAGRAWPLTTCPRAWAYSSAQAIADLPRLDLELVRPYPSPNRIGGHIRSRAALAPHNCRWFLHAAPHAP